MSRPAAFRIECRVPLAMSFRGWNGHVLAVLGVDLMVAFAPPLGMLPAIGFEEGDEAAAIHATRIHTKYTRARAVSNKSKYPTVSHAIPSLSTKVKKSSREGVDSVVCDTTI